MSIQDHYDCFQLSSFCLGITIWYTDFPLDYSFLLLPKIFISLVIQTFKVPHHYIPILFIISTVLCTYPSINAHSHGSPRRKYAAIASAIHSIIQGDAASRNTVKDNFFNATGSRPSPARIRITVNAICLEEETKTYLQYQSNPFNYKGNCKQKLNIK